MKYRETYIYSFVILIITSIGYTFWGTSNSFLSKIFLSVLMYVSLFLLPLRDFKNLYLYSDKLTRFLFYYLLFYGIALIISDLFSFEILSLFGNKYFGIVFLMPLFYLWTTKDSSLYWLNRFGILSIQLGFFIYIYSLISNSNAPTWLFAPSFFLLLNYKYVNRHDKIWIIIGTIVGVLVSISAGSRAGVLKIFMLILIFIYFSLRFDSKKYYKYIIIGFSILFLFILISITFNSFNIFSTLESNLESFDEEIAIDTRSYLYEEVFNDIDKSNTLIRGKGALGTYRSSYFFSNTDIGGDHFNRHIVETGFLYYLLKAGLLYLIPLIILFIKIIFTSLKKSKNRYILSYSTFLLSYLILFTFEYIPAFSIETASIWIVLGICASNKFQMYSDKDIRSLIQFKQTN